MHIYYYYIKQLLLINLKSLTKWSLKASTYCAPHDDPAEAEADVAGGGFVEGPWVELLEYDLPAGGGLGLQAVAGDLLCCLPRPS